MNNPAGDWFAMMNGEITEEEYKRRYPTTPLTPDREVVKVSQEMYGDRILYKDGHEEWRSIGD